MLFCTSKYAKKNYGLVAAIRFRNYIESHIFYLNVKNVHKQKQKDRIGFHIARRCGGGAEQNFRPEKIV